MNNYAFFAIPIIVGVIAGYIMVTNTNEVEPNDDVLLTASKLIENGSPMIGNPSAPITILEWGDYQCTFCFRFHESSLKILQEEYIDTGKVNLVFKDFPLNGPDSVLAAEASYCAEDQDKYWEYHSELYTNWAGEKTGWITRGSLTEFANSINLDINDFHECMNLQKYNQRVLELEEFGRQIGVDATPSFFVFNDEKIMKIRGNQPIDVFRQVIAELES